MDNVNKSAPPSGEVAALIERFENAVDFHDIGSVGSWACEARDLLARLSAPVPRLASDDVELLQMLIEDCENKYGDPHTLRHAKEVVDRLSAAAPVPAQEWPDTPRGVSAHLQEQHMQPHQQRVVDEKTALDEKLTKLNTFFHSTTYTGLSADEQDRLTRQHVAMDAYSKVLAERIAAF